MGRLDDFLATVLACILLGFLLGVGMRIAGIR